MLPIGAGIVWLFSVDACGRDSVKGRVEGLSIWMELFLDSNLFNALPISLRCKSVLYEFKGTELMLLSGLGLFDFATVGDLLHVRDYTEFWCSSSITVTLRLCLTSPNSWLLYGGEYDAST